MDNVWFEDDDEVLDVPDITSSGYDDYTTQFGVPLLKDQIYEQDEEDSPKPADDDQTQDKGNPEDSQQTTDAEEPSSGEEDTSIKDIGKIYTLKKIYLRLISLNNFLDTCNFELVPLKKKVNEALELFRLVIFNIKKIDENTVNELIVNYYKFIKLCYEMLSKHFKNKNSEK